MTANVVLYACTELLLVDKEGWLLGKAMCVVRAVTSLSVGEDCAVSTAPEGRDPAQRDVEGMQNDPRGAHARQHEG